MDGRKGGVDGWASVKNAEKDEEPILGIYEPVSNSFIEWHLRGMLRGSNRTDEEVCAFVGNAGRRNPGNKAYIAVNGNLVSSYGALKQVEKNYEDETK